MKSNRMIMIAAVAASCAALPLCAQNTGTSSPRQDNSAAQPSAPAQPSSQTGLVEVKGLMGRSVMDSQNREAGMVRDMFVDLHGGKVAEVVLNTRLPEASGNTGSDMGYGGPVSTYGANDEEQVTALPPSCFTLDASGKNVRINLTREDLRKGATFSLAQWKDAAVRSKIDDNYRHYGAPACQFGDLQRASSILGASVENDQNEKLGSVNNVVVNLPSGRVDEVILASGGFLGVDRSYTALAPQSFRYDAAQGKVILNMTPESIKNSPHFKTDEWRNNLIGQSGITSTVSGYTAADAPQR